MADLAILKAAFILVGNEFVGTWSASMGLLHADMV